jgi:YVTN family beta-propeller protein
VTSVKLKAGQEPTISVYNPANKDLYIVDETATPKPTSGNVTVLDSANKVKATVKVGADPVTISLNLNNNEVYVVNATNLGSTRSTNSSVTPISSSNVAGTPIKVGQGAFVATYDPVNHDMYVAEQYSNVTAFISSTNTVSTLTTKGSPSAAAFDPGTNDMLLILSTAATVDGKATILSSPTTGTPAIIGGLTVQKDPISYVYDPTYTNVYVSNAGSNSVTEF